MVNVKLFLFQFQENLNEYLQNDEFYPDMKVDFSKTFIMGHSSGNHVTVNYLKVRVIRK